MKITMVKGYKLEKINNRFGWSKGLCPPGDRVKGRLPWSGGQYNNGPPKGGTTVQLEKRVGSVGGKGEGYSPLTLLNCPFDRLQVCDHSKD